MLASSLVYRLSWKPTVSGEKTLHVNAPHDRTCGAPRFVPRIHVRSRGMVSWYMVWWCGVGPEGTGEERTCRLCSTRRTDGVLDAARGWGAHGGMLSFFLSYLFLFFFFRLLTAFVVLACCAAPTTHKVHMAVPVFSSEVW